MNAMLDSNSYYEREHDAADTAWARIEAAYRDEAVSDVAARFNALAPQDFGEPTAYLTADEEQQFQKALVSGDSDHVGELYMIGLDNMREQYMTSDAAEKAVQERIYELAQEDGQL